jgi:hypothetical protein
MTARRNRERLHIDFGVFPDLRINQPIEQKGKQFIEQALIGEDAVRRCMRYTRLVDRPADVH